MKFSINEDNLCDDCPFTSSCENFGNNSICNRLFYFKRALSVSNLYESECVPFRPDVSNDTKAFELLYKINSNINEFVSGGYNLMLMGKPGTGKTSSAIKLMLNYLSYLSKYNQPMLARSDEDGKYLSSVYIVRQNDLLNISCDIDAYLQLKKRVCDAYLVVFDDIGVRGLTESSTARLCELLDMRIGNDRSSIYTTNLGGTSLKNTLDKRIVSRMQYKHDTITFLGDDMREKQGGFLSKW